MFQGCSSTSDSFSRYINLCVCVLCILYSKRLRYTHTQPFNSPFSRTAWVKPIWILLKQETVSGSGISWDICKSTTRSRQITMPAPHHSVFYRPDALPAAQPTATKHWRHKTTKMLTLISAAAMHIIKFFRMRCSQGFPFGNSRRLKNRSRWKVYVINCTVDSRM